MKSRRKTVSLILVLALLAALWLPVGPAFAAEASAGIDLALDDLLGGVLGGVGGLLTGVGDLLETTTSALGDTLDTTTGAADDLVTGLTGSVGDLVTGVGGVTGDLVGTLGDALSGILGGLGKTLDGVVGGVGKTLGSVGAAPAGKKKVVVTFRVGEKTYTMNGRVAAMDVAPYIKYDRCFLPARFVGYSLGIMPENIVWNQATKTATLSKNGTTIRMTIGSRIMYINNMAVQIDAPPELVPPGRTMLPYRWVAEAFGATVSWEPNTKTVTIEYYE